MAYQNYIDNNKLELNRSDENYVNKFTQRLKNMTDQLTNDTNTCVSIFSDVPKNSQKLAPHTTISDSFFYKYKYDGKNSSVMDWVIDATNGKCYNYGLDLY